MFFRIKLLDDVLDLYFKNCSHVDLAKKSVVLGVITSVFLIVLKLITWMITDFISMRASMNDSILDALTSFMAYHALRFSAVSFDKEHNFGHEKIEGIMAFCQCLLVVYSGVMIFVEAYEVLLNPKPLKNGEIGIAVMVISCFAVYQLLYFQKYVALKTNSVLVRGDSLHYLSDFLVNICIIASLLISKFFPHIDVVCGVIIGGYVLYNALLILKGAMIDLMDESLPSETCSDIFKTANSVSGVEKIKRLRTRSAGMKKYVELRVKVDSKISLIEADNITREIEHRLHKMFEKVDAIVRAESDDQL
ncbi:MAG: cation diffusion facilitator family transporter [Holosporaceae bacterium]|jgi:ferrous-iron efflux pump FieF|nr:cation diffusion facilitator family transporter [Holosporaceae bacterium]